MKAWLRFFQFFSCTFTPLFFLSYFFMDYSDESIAFGIVLLSIISTAVGFIGANSHSDVLPQAFQANLSTDSLEEDEEDPFEEVKKKKKKLLVAFTYQNEKGTISEREVYVTEINGDYIDGYCLRAEGERTFLKSRIIGNAVNTETGEIMDW